MKIPDKIYRSFCVCIFFMSSAQLVYAVDIDGVNIPEQVTQPESGQSLVLNGTGMRTKFIFDIYIGALYLTEKSTDAKHIIDAKAAKRISMYFVYDKIEKEKMIDGWNDAFADAIDEASFKALKARIDQFNSYFPDIVKGDMVVLDFIPKGGVAISINKQRKGVIPGDDFQRALLRIWLGDSPPNAALKDGMLGIAQD